MLLYNFELYIGGLEFAIVYYMFDNYVIKNTGYFS